MNILIRDLDSSTAEEVEKIKAKVQEKTNSKAVLFAINDFMYLDNRLKECREENRQLKKEIAEQKEIIDSIHYISDRIKMLEDSKKTVDDEYSNYG